MKLSRAIVTLIIILIFVSILVGVPDTHIQFQIPQNPIVDFLADHGMLDKDKIIDGKYSYNKVIQAPSVQCCGNFKFLNSNGDLQLGLDLQGGTYIALKADMTGVADGDKVGKLNDVRAVMEGRLNQYGLSETNVYSSISGQDYKVVIELPGKGSEVESQIENLKSTAKLEILVPKDAEAEGISPSVLISVDPTGATLRKYYIPSGVTGADLKTASISSGGGSTSGQAAGQYSVLLSFTNEGAKKFAAVENQYYQKTTAIVLDNTLISAVTLQVKDVGGTERTITGNFDKATADKLAIQLRGGALPIPVTLAEQRTIEASLGLDALQKSLAAGAIGIGLVIIFMIVMYRREGLIAAIALVLYALFSVALFKLLAIHLTLAGFAGFILSIGIAVDANILIFERMKEEIKLGKNKRAALALGFERAWTSIRDSNLSTLITCLILYMFGSTVTKGFAINLALGVLLSLFTAITVTRQLLIIFLNASFQKSASSNVIQQTN